MRIETVRKKIETAASNNKTLQAELAELRLSQRQEPALIPDDLQTVLSNLTTVTSKLAAGTVTTAPTTPTTPRPKSTAGTWRAKRFKKIKQMNGGKGRYYEHYCWNCGLTPNHTAAACHSLTPEQREKYKNVTLANRMGGSTKNLERACKYEHDFDFKM